MDEFDGLEKAAVGMDKFIARCTPPKPFGQKVLEIMRSSGSSGLPFKLPFVGSVTAGAVRACEECSKFRV